MYVRVGRVPDVHVVDDHVSVVHLVDGQEPIVHVVGGRYRASVDVVVHLRTKQQLVMLLSFLLSIYSCNRTIVQLLTQVILLGSV
jgi:hypothetical protein